MSDEKNFFARWSRRKHGANPETTEQSKPENCGDVLVSKLPTASLSQASSFDAASLPAIDSIGPGSDIRSFLEVGVPADLTRAALRRVWLTDPAIRDFVGLSENSWDFNAPGAIPGFGSIDAESVANMVTRLLGGPDAIATEKDALLKVPYANEDSLRAGAPVEDIPTDSPSGIQNLSQVRLAEPSAVDAHEVTPQVEVTTAGNSGSCERTESKSRRSHGGALPELP
jgi:hypothetical protein